MAAARSAPTVKAFGLLSEPVVAEAPGPGVGVAGTSADGAVAAGAGVGGWTGICVVIWGAGVEGALEVDAAVELAVGALGCTL